MKKGFTLIELLAVVIMVAILSSIALPQYRRSINRARVTEAKQMLPAIYDSTQRWMFENQVESTKGLTFGKLDISLKGSAKEDDWYTPHFKYVFPKFTNGTMTSPATATMADGKYKGLEISFDGTAFTCKHPSSEEYCKYLGAD